MTGICLNMIVKDETPVLRDCFASVRPWITSWVIVDTGSTDGTQALIRELLGDLPGELHERPWKDFGHNRTEALELARTFVGDQPDYLLFIDADDLLRIPAGFALPPLTHDAYHVELRLNDLAYARCALVVARVPWRYVGVLHEVLTGPAGHSLGRLEGPYIQARVCGARSAAPDKYARDAAVFEKALQDEPDNARYVFYLGQSHRDANQPDKALTAYRRRVTLGGWGEEVFYSLYMIARLGEILNWPKAQVTDAYLAAYQYRPTRAEPLVQLARVHRMRQEYAVSFLFADAARKTPRPADILFVEEDLYRWRAADEYAIAAYWLDRPQDSLAVCEELLGNPALPDNQRQRIIDNANFARTRLGLPRG